MEAYGKRHVIIGDTIVLWYPERLGRSLAQLNETVNTLETRGIGCKALTVLIDTISPAGNPLPYIWLPCRVREIADQGRYQRRPGCHPKKFTKTQMELAKRMYHDERAVIKTFCQLFGSSTTTIY